MLKCSGSALAGCSLPPCMGAAWVAPSRPGLAPPQSWPAGRECSRAPHLGRPALLHRQPALLPVGGWAPAMTAAGGTAPCVLLGHGCWPAAQSIGLTHVWHALQCWLLYAHRPGCWSGLVAIPAFCLAAAGDRDLYRWDHTSQVRYRGKRRRRRRQAGPPAPCWAVHPLPVWRCERSGAASRVASSHTHACWGPMLRGQMALPSSSAPNSAFHSPILACAASPRRL